MEGFNNEPERGNTAVVFLAVEVAVATVEGTDADEVICCFSS